MGLRGPKSKPTSIKAAEGNVGHRPLRAKSLTFGTEAKAPPRPEFLSTVGRRVWDRLIKQLRRRGLVRVEDQMQLTAICIAYEVLADAYRELRALDAPAAPPAAGDAAPEPPRSRYMIRNGTGGYKPNPLLAIIYDQTQVINRISADFGLNPISRVRLEGEDDVPLLPTGARSKSLEELLSDPTPAGPRVKLN